MDKITLKITLDAQVAMDLAEHIECTIDGEDMEPADSSVDADREIERLVQALRGA